MIERLRRYFFSVIYPYTDPYDATNARDFVRYLVVTSTILIVLVVIPGLLGAFPVTVPVLGAIALILLVAQGLIYLVQSGRIRIARELLVILSLLAGGLTTLQPDQTLSVMLILLVAPLITALLLPRRAIIVVLVITFILYGLVLFSRPTLNISITVANRTAVAASVLSVLGIIALLLLSFGESAARLTRIFANEGVSLRRALNSPELLTISTPETTLLRQIVDRLKSDYGFSLARVALLDGQRERARLYYTGFGIDELQVGEQVSMDDPSPLTNVMRTGDITVINQDSGSLNRRYLSAGMEMALLIPIVSEQGIMGALDLQSRTQILYTPNQLEALQAYALRVGLALERTRIFAQLRTDIELQTDIIEKLQKRIADLQQGTSGQVDTSSWQRYLAEYSGGSLGFDLQNGATLTAASDLTPAIRAALASGSIVSAEEDGHTVVRAPIVLRDELLGSLSFMMPVGEQLNERQRDLISNVVERLGLALENRRLLVQSQTQAAREAKANEVASILFSTTDMQTLLNVAAEQFTEALGAVNTQVTLEAFRMKETS